MKSCKRNSRSARVKISSTTSSGCTTASSPKYSATALSTNTPTANACPTSHTGWRIRYRAVRHRDVPSGTPRPANRAITAHDALQKAAPKAAMTVSKTDLPGSCRARPDIAAQNPEP